MSHKKGARVGYIIRRQQKLDICLTTLTSVTLNAFPASHQSTPGTQNCLDLTALGTAHAALMTAGTANSAGFSRHASG